MFTSSKSSIIYLVLIAILSFIVAQTALNNRKKFDQTNIPVYDGVLYEFQQLKRYQKYDGNFGFKNRVSQSIYEYKANPVGGMYTVLLTLFAPSLLQNDIDILLRSFFGLFLFNLSFFIVFRRKYSNWWTFCLLVILSQLPIFYHYRIGLGSYTPELIGAVYLLAGYLFLYQFIKEKKNLFFLIGINAFLFPLAFRFNFFAYASLLSIPLIVLFVREYSKFSFKNHRFVLVIGLFIILLYLVNFIYHFGMFYSYYTTVCYAIGNLEAAILYYGLNVHEFYSALFIVLLFFAFIGNSLFKKDIHSNFILPFWEIIVFIYPFLIYTGFVLFIMNSTNTPHIMSVSLFFGILVLPLFGFKSRNHLFKLLIKFRFVISSVILIFCCILFIYNNLLHSRKLEAQYAAQRFTVNYIKSHSVKSMFNCYDAMLDIPINTSLFNETKKMIPSTGSFVTNDIYLHFSCKTYQACLAQFVDQVNQADLIVINEKETDPYILPMSKKIRVQLREKLLKSNTHKLVLKKYFPFYGNILFYRLK